MSRTRPSPAGVSAFELLRWLLRFARPHWRTFVVVIALMGVYSVGNQFRLALFGLLADSVVLPADRGGDRGFLIETYERLTPEHFHIPVVDEKTFRAREVDILEGELVEPLRHDPDKGAWVAAYRRGRVRLRTETGTLVDTFDRLELARSAPPEAATSDAIVTICHGDELTDRGRVPFLLMFGSSLAVIALVIALSNYGRMYLYQVINVKIIVAIREEIFRHLSKLSIDFYQGRRAGDLISRVTHDVGLLQISLRYFFGELLQHPITIVLAIGVAFIASWQLTLMLSPLMLLVVVPIFRAGRKVKRHGRGSMAKLGEVTEAMSQLLSGFRVVKAFGMEDAQCREYSRRNADFMKSNLKMVRARVMGRSLAEGLYNLLAAIALLFAAWLLISQFVPLTFGTFALLFGAIASMYQPIKALSRAYTAIQEARAAAERVFEVLGQQPTVADRPGAPPAPPFHREIRCEGVSFRYGEEDPWALRDIELTVEKGETIALVGRSGAGKSTLLDLIARFYDPTSGRILLDGVDLRDFAHASYLEQIAIVGQDPFLFHASVRENIGFGKLGATDADIEAAARAAAIHDEILALPERYDTVIGERGSKLSGGQRQRITIARAILKGAPILILDEATSALDSESEQKVQAALENLMEGHTTFVIAHRLSTIKHADRILVLDGGFLREVGTHEELVRRGGHYAHLLELQDRGYTGASA